MEYHNIKNVDVLIVDTLKRLNNTGAPEETIITICVQVLQEFKEKRIKLGARNFGDIVESRVKLLNVKKQVQEVTNTVLTFDPEEVESNKPVHGHDF